MTNGRNKIPNDRKRTLEEIRLPYIGTTAKLKKRVKGKSTRNVSKVSSISVKLSKPSDVAVTGLYKLDVSAYFRCHEPHQR